MSFTDVDAATLAKPVSDLASQILTALGIELRPEPAHDGTDLAAALVPARPATAVTVNLVDSEGQWAGRLVVAVSDVAGKVLSNGAEAADGLTDTINSALHVLDGIAGDLLADKLSVGEAGAALDGMRRDNDPLPSIIPFFNGDLHIATVAVVRSASNSEALDEPEVDATESDSAAATSSDREQAAPSASRSTGGSDDFPVDEAAANRGGSDDFPTDEAAGGRTRPVDAASDVPAGPAQSRPAAAPAYDEGPPIPAAEMPQLPDAPAPVSRPARPITTLNEVALSVTVELGRTELPLRALLGLHPGAVIQLDRAVSAPVDIYANGTRIGRGEMVVVDNDYGVRITELVEGD